MQRPTTRRDSPVWPLLVLASPFAALTVIGLVVAAVMGVDPRAAGADAAADSAGQAIGLAIRQHWQVTLGVLAAGAGALAYRSRRVLAGR